MLVTVRAEPEFGAIIFSTIRILGTQKIVLRVLMTSTDKRSHSSKRSKKRSQRSDYSKIIPHKKMCKNTEKTSTIFFKHFNINFL